MEIILEQKSRIMESDVETPISLFLRHVGGNEGILLESAEVDGRWGRHSVIAGDFLLVISCVNGLMRLDIRAPGLASLRTLDGMPFMEGLRAVTRALNIKPAKRENEDFPPITRAIYGYLGYGLSGLMEPRLAAVLPPEESESCLALPGTLIFYDHAYNRVYHLSLCPPQPHFQDREMNSAGTSSTSTSDHRDLSMLPAGISEPASTMSKDEYMETVRGIKELIRQGEAIQIVPSLGFQARFHGEPFTVYRRLRRVNPSPYMFFMRLPGLTLLGSSPETLVGCEGGTLRLCPIAGTRPRGEGEAEDNLFEAELVSDPKEQAEHVMLVDLGRNDLGRVAKTGSVSLERYMEVERFSHVMHLTSYIRAELAPQFDVIDALSAVFPAGTVSGAPKIRAMEIIAGVEKRARGPYAGAIGWLGLDRNEAHMDTGITIRSIWFKDGQAFWQAGGGVVLDSSPEAEWNECNNKAAVAVAVLKG